MAAKSGNIASFVFVNSANFQKNSIKPVEVHYFYFCATRAENLSNFACFCVLVRTILVCHVCFLLSTLHWLLGHVFRGRNEENDVFRACYVSSKETKGESLATAINNGTAILLSAVTMRTHHYA